MKRTRILGLCMVAAFAVTAFAFTATSALAAPEYADCIKVTTKKGKFTEANCIGKTTTGNFELKKVVPGVGATEESVGKENEPLKIIKSKGTTAHLETEAGTTIECTANSSESEIIVKFGTTGKQLPSKEVHKVKATFTGCTEAGKNCQTSPAEKNKITTNLLKGPLGYISGKGTNGVSTVLGQELTPEVKKGTFATFECESIGEVKVGQSPTGKLGDCIIAPFTKASINTQSETGELQFNGKNGIEGREQEPQHFEGKTTHCNLESKLGEGPWERSVQVGNSEQTSEAKMEIRGL